MLQAGVVTLDLHGRTQYQARIAIDAALRRSNGVYRIRLIHGSHAGTALRDMVRSEYGQHPRVKSIEADGDDRTTLVLRALYGK